MTTNLYFLETLTNLHVGSGDINFDIIDNQVQKDECKIPIIHSSSLKGAFREHFETRGENFIDYIFGSESDSDENRAGAYSFFEAKLLTRPVRSNVRPFFNATTPSILKDLIELVKILEIANNFLEELEKFYKEIKDIKKPMIFEEFDKDVYLEDFEADYKEDTKIPDIKYLNNLAILPFEDFVKLELPVIARNKLNNGKSDNLWYEEIVPKKSVFYFLIAKPDHIDKEDKGKADKFDRSFEKEQIVQIGANKSIGYGFCKIERIGK